MLRQRKRRARAASSERSEVEIQKDVLALLERHPAIAWVHRINVGGGCMKSGRWVNFAFEGCSDIIGQTRTGLFFACEVKRSGERCTPAQLDFLRDINQNNGVAIVASGTEKVTEVLNDMVRRVEDFADSDRNG